VAWTKETLGQLCACDPPPPDPAGVPPVCDVDVVVVAPPAVVVGAAVVAGACAEAVGAGWVALAALGAVGAVVVAAWWDEEPHPAVNAARDATTASAVNPWIRGAPRSLIAAEP